MASRERRGPRATRAGRHPSRRRAPPPVLDKAARRRRFQEGIALFNAGDFFAAHEAWEEIWRCQDPEPRDLFQGLIQIAAGLHGHLALGRREGARHTIARGRRRLEPFLPTSHGLDLAALAAAARAWEDWLEGDAEGEGPAPPRLHVAAANLVR